MGKVRVGGFSVSVDGFGAGPEQSFAHPLGRRGEELHRWFFHTRFFKQMTGQDGGSDGVDQDFGSRAMASLSSASELSSWPSFL